MTSAGKHAIRCFIMLGCLSAGCGGGGAGTDDAATLGMRVQWASVSSECGDDAIPAPLPSAAARIRVIVAGENGRRCCVKFDPNDHTLRGERHVVLTQLPEGAATVDVTAFASTVVPGDGADEKCQIERPAGFGDACDAEEVGCAQVAYSLDGPIATDLRAGQEAQVTACEIARPYYIASAPPCDGDALDNPVNLAFVFGETTQHCECNDGELICDPKEPRIPRDLQVSIVQKPASASGKCSAATADPAAIPVQASVETFCCQDEPDCTTGRCCTGPNDAAHVASGFIVTVNAVGLEVGCAEVRVVTTLPGAGADPLTQSFAVRVGPPTPTVAPSPTVTPTPTATPTLTLTPTVTPTSVVGIL